MSRIRSVTIASMALAAAFVACSDPGSTGVPVASGPSASVPSLDRATLDQPGTSRQYGTPVRVGDGTVRTYIVRDEKHEGRPLEVGVAMSEHSMDGLPTAMPMPASAAKGEGHDHSSMVMNMYLLDLPAQNPTQYRFVQFDWNPLGHDPVGVYDLPHFDFHFYTVSKEVRASILPTDPQFDQKAANFPAPDFRSPFYIDAATAAGIAPGLASVPQMGLHWLDVRSPELQMMTGNPAGYKPFTKTFIYGSWNGKFIFDEPMITRAYILEKKTATDPAVIDELIPVSTAPRYSPAGFYPAAYRITWDAQRKEYRIALTQLGYRN